MILPIYPPVSPFDSALLLASDEKGGGEVIIVLVLYDL